MRMLFIILMYIMVGYANEDIPKNFYYYQDSLKSNVDSQAYSIFTPIMGAENYYPYFSGMLEHESCVTLTNQRCWSAKSELLTRWPNGRVREQGVGLGQITRAYSESGMIRLDVLTDLKKRYPKELSELTWDNIKERGDLQIRAVILLWLSNYNRIPEHISDLDKMAIADSAYNGGYGFIIKDRKVCGLKSGCDPNLWFNNLEKINNRGTRILYGTRTANDINRHHVRDVLLERMAKYYTIDW